MHVSSLLRHLSRADTRASSISPPGSVPHFNPNLYLSIQINQQIHQAAMMLCRIVLFPLITAVSGLRWVGPQETISATATADWTPAPTKVTENTAHELFGRSLYPANLCGAQGSYYVKAYCGDKSYCAWFTDIKVVGCCSSGGACDAVYTSCIDQRDDTPQGEYIPGVFTCTNLCYRNTFPNGYYQYGCGSTSIGETVVYSWPGDNPEVSIAILYTGGAFKETTAPTSTILIDTSTSEAEETSTTSTNPLPSSKSVTTSSVESTESPASPTTVTRSPRPPSPPSEGSTIVTTVAATSRKASSTISSSASETSDAARTEPKGQSKGLSEGAKIAIGVVTAVVGIVIIVSLAYGFFRRYKQRKDSQHFLNTSAGANTCQIPQYDQPVMGTRLNPTELYQHPPVQSRGPQYHPVPARESPQDPPVQSMGPQYHEAPARESPQDPPVQSRGPQYHEVPARESPQHPRESDRPNSAAFSWELHPSYEPVRQVSTQSPVSPATFPTASPQRPSVTLTPPTPQYPHRHELAADGSARIPELDSIWNGDPGWHAPYPRI
ncbi:hypothetical protein BKA61DRAFT_159710 [Leptodontidium sp. MPI-SDFR-AT-0119]|nr:hypothetical protein BKA61DRAFT_159710 [Leptodontidium sp. MPI-SDFR-AT-0119]